MENGTPPTNKEKRASYLFSIGDLDVLQSLQGWFIMVLDHFRQQFSVLEQSQPELWNAL